MSTFVILWLYLGGMIFVGNSKEAEAHPAPVRRFVLVVWPLIIPFYLYAFISLLVQHVRTR